MVKDALFMDNFIRTECLRSSFVDLSRKLARLPVPADWPVDNLSGLKKLIKLILHFKV